jgi:N-methylhydantoinase B
MARILETATAPVTAVDVDVITLDLVENALRNARYEMDEVLFRTALSPGIREQHDEFPLIADPAGKMVVGQFGLSIPDFLDNYAGTIEEGDVLLTSDPYSSRRGDQHARWLVVVPFFRGRLVVWSACSATCTDVGGRPVLMPTDAKTIFEEGRGHPALQALPAGRS